MRWLIPSLTIVALAGVSRADLNIQFGEVRGSEGQWHEGTAIIPAPIDQVRGWLTDYAHWPQLFSDISEAWVEGHTPDGAAIVHFRSRIAGREIVIRERVTPFGLAYEGESRRVTVQGRIYLTDLGNGTTRVSMQSSADVHGILRPFATAGLKRTHEYAHMRSDLTSLYQLSCKK
jgi:hypothetical protein